MLLGVVAMTEELCFNDLKLSLDDVKGYILQKDYPHDGFNSR